MSLAFLLDPRLSFCERGGKGALMEAKGRARGCGSTRSVWNAQGPPADKKFDTDILGLVSGLPGPVSSFPLQLHGSRCSLHTSILALLRPGDLLSTCVDPEPCPPPPGMTPTTPPSQLFSPLFFPQSCFVLGCNHQCLAYLSA